MRAAASTPGAGVFRERILAVPRNFIAQPRWRCRAPPLLDERSSPHVDLRPYVATATKSPRPGGLTVWRAQVAVVNSSQAGE